MLVKIPVRKSIKTKLAKIMFEFVCKATNLCKVINTIIFWNVAAKLVNVNNTPNVFVQ